MGPKLLLRLAPLCTSLRPAHPVLQQAFEGILQHHCSLELPLEHCLEAQTFLVKVMCGKTGIVPKVTSGST